MNYYHNDYDNDDDDTSTAELRWNFFNFEEAVMDKYTQGKALSGKIVPLGGDGSYWRVDFYPNGKDDTTAKKICFQITLTNDSQDSILQVDGECTYRILNRDSMKSYIGRVRRQNYYSFESVCDSSFPSWILSNCKHDCVIVISITHYSPFLFIEQQINEQQEDEEVFYAINEDTLDYNQPIHISSIYSQNDLLMDDDNLNEENYDNLTMEQLQELLTKTYSRY